MERAIRSRVQRRLEFEFPKPDLGIEGKVYRLLTLGTGIQMESSKIRSFKDMRDHTSGALRDLGWGEPGQTARFFRKIDPRACRLRAPQVGQHLRLHHHHRRRRRHRAGRCRDQGRQGPPWRAQALPAGMVNFRQLLPGTRAGRGRRPRHRYPGRHDRHGRPRRPGPKNRSEEIAA